MPVVNFHCQKCDRGEEKLVDMGAKPEFKCSTCGEVMVRLRGKGKPTVQVVERLDNGAMGRTLERFSEAERLTDERAHQHNRELRHRLGYRDEVEE